MLAQDEEGKTIWHVAAQRSNLELLEKLCRDRMNNTPFSEEDNFEETALGPASYRINVQMLDRIWKFAKEQLTTDDLKTIC